MPTHNFSFSCLLHSLTLWTEIQRHRGCSRWGNHVLRWGSGCWTSGEGYERTNNTEKHECFCPDPVNAYRKPCKRNVFWARTSFYKNYLLHPNTFRKLDVIHVKRKRKTDIQVWTLLYVTGRSVAYVNTVIRLQRCLALAFLKYYYYWCWKYWDMSTDKKSYMRSKERSRISSYKVVSSYGSTPWISMLFSLTVS